MTEYLASDLEQRLPELGRLFRSAEPFPHIVIERFLDDGFCRELKEQFPVFNPEQARNEYGEVAGKAVHSNLPALGPAYKQLDEILKSEPFLKIISEMTGIPDLLYDPEYVGGGTHENLHGQDLDAHVDFNYHPTTRLHRRLNLILFLNHEWKDEWGGSLQFHKNPWTDLGDDEVKTATPLYNRCVLFETSELSWHGFRRLNLPEDKRSLTRQSIAVYFYTKERPKDQTAPDHSTVYVPRGLPESLKPGQPVSDETFQQVRLLTVRRDQQIRFLYEREKEYSEVMESFRWKVGDQQRRLDEQQSEIDALHLEVTRLAGMLDAHNNGGGEGAQRRPEEYAETLQAYRVQLDENRRELNRWKIEAEERADRMARAEAKFQTQHREYTELLEKIFHSPTFRAARVIGGPFRALRGLLG